jgi:hypothetical protein
VFTFSSQTLLVAGEGSGKLVLVYKMSLVAKFLNSPIYNMRIYINQQFHTIVSLCICNNEILLVFR